MITVLAIGAHPDDIELGCSGTLLRHIKIGNRVYLLCLTKGEASGDPIRREEECRTAAKCIGACDIFFGGLKDTKIDDGIQTIMVIENVINKIKPDIIYTHSYKDTHQDHRNTAYATLSAGRRINKIFMYESPTTSIEFSPQLLVDITEEFEQKKKIMNLFISQFNKDWYSLSRARAGSMAFEGLALYRGFQARVRVAEAFEVGKLVITSYEMVSHNLL